MGHNGYKTELENELCDNLLFVHAFLGCDTPSSIFGIGKCASVFTNSENISMDDIINYMYDEKAMPILFFFFFFGGGGGGLKRS